MTNSNSFRTHNNKLASSIEYLYDKTTKLLSVLNMLQMVKQLQKFGLLVLKMETGINSQVIVKIVLLYYQIKLFMKQ